MKGRSESEKGRQTMHHFTKVATLAKDDNAHPRTQHLVNHGGHHGGGGGHDDSGHHDGGRGHHGGGGGGS